MPIQPGAAEGVQGYIELLPEYTEGLKDLDGFSHLILLYHLHKVDGYKLMVKPFMDNEEHGIFATRAPKRPNAIGISTVELEKVEGNKVYLNKVDMLDGTPLIDIKPFFPRFDNHPDAIGGWQDKNKQGLKDLRSDERFR